MDQKHWRNVHQTIDGSFLEKKLQEKYDWFLLSTLHTSLYLHFVVHISSVSLVLWLLKYSNCAKLSWPEIVCGTCYMSAQVEN